MFNVSALQHPLLWSTIRTILVWSPCFYAANCASVLRNPKKMRNFAADMVCTAIMIA